MPDLRGDQERQVSPGRSMEGQLSYKQPTTSSILSLGTQ